MGFTIEVDFGTGFEHITQHCGDIERTQCLHNGLGPTINTCRFTVRDKTTANKFNTSNVDLPLQIKKDDVLWFVGLIRPTFENTVGASLKVFNVEGYDKGILLQKQIDQSFAYADYKVSDPANKGSSIMHQLFYEAGISDGELDFILIDKVIDYFVIEREDKAVYLDEITALLFEFGYVYDCKGSGIFELQDLFPISLPAQTVVDDSKIYHDLKVQKVETKYSGVRVTWHPHLTLTDRVVFSDTTDGDSTNKCNITLGAGDWYPVGADTLDVHSKYQLTDYDLIIVLNAYLNWAKTSVTLNTWTPKYKRALVKFTSPAGGSITRFDINGDPVVIDRNIINRSVQYLVPSTEKIREIEARYITSKADSDRLCNGLVKWYDFADFTYSFPTGEAYVVGEYLDFYEGVLDITTSLRVVEIIENEQGDKRIRCEGVDAYTLGSMEEQNDITSPPIVTTIRDAEERYVTKVEDQVGYIGGGGTTVAAKIVVSNCYAIGFNGITLSWERQHNLTNFSHYEIQVSSNETNWYKLRNDGVDWKGVEGQVTSVLDEYMTHQNIPAADPDNPVPIQLFYRVRVVSLAPDEGDWSDTVDATINLIESKYIKTDAITTAKLINAAVEEAKIAVDAVTENKIKADAVVAAKIKAGAVVTDKLFALAVVAGKIAAGAVETAKLHALAVTAAKISAGAVETDKLHALAVTAEKIAVAALQAQFVNVSFALTIGFSGTGTPDSPDEGDRRQRLDGDEVLFQIFTNGNWSTERQITFGGVDGNSNFRPFLSCRGVLGDITTSPLLDPLPDESFYFFKFQNNVDDEDGIGSLTIIAVNYTGSGWDGAAITVGTMLTFGFFGGPYDAGESVTADLKFFLPTGYATNSDILTMGNTTDGFALRIVSSDRAQLKVYKNGTSTLRESAVMAENAWHSISFTYNVDTNYAYLITDGGVMSWQPSGSWGATSGANCSIQLLVAGMRMDELAMSVRRFCNIDYLIQHHIRQVTWASAVGYSRNDLYLEAREDGIVRLLDSPKGMLKHTFSNLLTTGQKVWELWRRLPPGGYHFKFCLILQTVLTTTGARFGINFTGTQTAFFAKLIFPTNNAAGAVGTADDEVSGGTVNLQAMQVTRLESTTTPNLTGLTAVTTADANICITIEGMIVVSAIGNLELWFASEVPGSYARLMEGSCVIINKVGPEAI